MTVITAVVMMMAAAVVMVAVNCGGSNDGCRSVVMMVITCGDSDGEDGDGTYNKLCFYVFNIKCTRFNS